MVPSMARPHSSFDADEVIRIAALSGIPLRADDAEALAPALAGHCEMVAPLFELPLEEAPVASTFDPRWRG